MSVQYKIIENALTLPLSYSARVVPRDVLELDDIAEKINDSNPTITASIAKTVLNALSNEVLYQLSEGNFVNISGFVSFQSSLPVRFESASDPLPQDVVTPSFRPSSIIKKELQSIARYERLPFTVKRPEILSVFHAASDLLNYFVDGQSLNLYGNNLEFDTSDDEQGIFVTFPGGYIDKQTNYSLLENKNIIFTVNLEGPLSVYDYAEYAIRVKSNLGGSTRIRQTAELVRMRKKINLAEGENNNTFFDSSENMNDMPLAAMLVTRYLGSLIDVVLLARMRPSGGLYLSVGPLGGDMGPEVLVEENSVHLTLLGLPEVLSVQLLSYDRLLQAVIRYARYLRDIASLHTINPI